MRAGRPSRCNGLHCTPPRPAPHTRGTTLLLSTRRQTFHARTQMLRQRDQEGGRGEALSQRSFISRRKEIGYSLSTTMEPSSTRKDGEEEEERGGVLVESHSFPPLRTIYLPLPHPNLSGRRDAWPGRVARQSAPFLQQRSIPLWFARVLMWKKENSSSPYLICTCRSLTTSLPPSLPHRSHNSLLHRTSSIHA